MAFELVGWTGKFQRLLSPYALGGLISRPVSGRRARASSAFCSVQSREIELPVLRRAIGQANSVIEGSRLNPARFSIALFPHFNLAVPARKDLIA